MLGELLKDMAHSTAQGTVGVSLIFIYLAWIITVAFIRIHQGKKEGGHHEAVSTGRALVRPCSQSAHPGRRARSGWVFRSAGPRPCFRRAPHKKRPGIAPGPLRF